MKRFISKSLVPLVSALFFVAFLMVLATSSGSVAVDVAKPQVVSEQTTLVNFCAIAQKGTCVLIQILPDLGSEKPKSMTIETSAYDLETLLPVDLNFNLHRVDDQKRFIFGVKTLGGSSMVEIPGDFSYSDKINTLILFSVGIETEKSLGECTTQISREHFFVRAVCERVK